MRYSKSPNRHCCRWTLAAVSEGAWMYRNYLTVADAWLNVNDVAAVGAVVEVGHSLIGA